MSAWLAPFDGAQRRDLAPGEHLFRREQRVRSAYLVETGEIALERAVADGAILTLQVARPGVLLAEASLFADAYHCDAVARAPARVAIVAKPAFLSALSGSAEAMMDLLARSAREVQAQRARIEILRLRRVADRLDAWLAMHGAPAAGGWVRVAEEIGVTAPALYRELARRRGR